MYLHLLLAIFLYLRSCLAGVASTTPATLSGTGLTGTDKTYYDRTVLLDQNKHGAESSTFVTVSRTLVVRAAAVEQDKVPYTVVHVSWNGATEVKEWHVYHTNSEGKERKLAAKAEKHGFETVVWSEGWASRVVVEGIDKDGDKLGESYVFPTIPTKEELDASLSNKDHLHRPEDTISTKIAPSLPVDPSNHVPELPKMIYRLLHPLVAFLAGFILTNGLIGLILLMRHRAVGEDPWRDSKGAYEPVREDDRDEDTCRVP
jgi:hypothetical protein